MIYSVDCPVGFSVQRTFGMVEATTVITLSEKGAFREWAEGRGAGHLDAMHQLVRMIPPEANSVVGVRVSTSGIVDGRGDVLLALTYIGTPVTLDPAPPRFS